MSNYKKLIFYKNHCIGKSIFLLLGINFKDLVKLTNKQILGDRIIYERSKTKIIYSIGIEEEVNVLLKKLSKGGITLIGVLDGEIQLLDQDIEELKRYRQYLHYLSYYFFFYSV